jgi:hypothetical protein
MRQSYEDADKVLVLDRYLLEQNCSGMSVEEIAMRITCAPWNRRLWTLQEGMLARSLVFQFCDTFVDLNRWIRQNRATLKSLIFCQTWRNYASLRVFETEESKKMNIQQAKKALTFRLTSVNDDEPLCLGNLLGLDPDSVVRARSRAERMKLIWRSIPKHFASTLFWSSPKLKDEGYRWAAASLMEEGCGRVQTCSEDARWDAGLGLIVTLPGILFTRSSLTILDSFRLILDGKTRLVVQWDLQWNSRFVTATPYQARTVTSANAAKFAILLVKPLPMEVEDGTDVAFFAQACDVLKIDQHRIDVRILGRVRIYRLEYLKHHPDVLISQTYRSEGHPTLPLQPSEPDEGAQENLRASRADVIWQQDDSSEIAQGTVLEESVWCVD